MKRRCRLWIARIALLCGLTLLLSTVVTTASAADRSTDLLKQVLIARTLIQACPDGAHPLCVEGERKRAEAAYAAATEALLTRARMLHPVQSEAAISAALDRWLARQNSRFSEMVSRDDACCVEAIKKLTPVWEEFVGQSMIAKWGAYGTATQTYDTPKPIELGAAEATYALNRVKQIVFSRLLDAFHGVECEGTFDIESITLANRNVREARNLPIFILPPIHYEEIWRAQCGMKKAALRVIFVRDSDGTLDRHTVVTPMED